MSSEADEQPSRRKIRSAVRETVGVNLVVMAVVGVLAGYSISVLGKDVVVVPVVGSVSGLLLGTAGLVAAAGVYRRLGSDCGCTGDCGDSCSYES